VRRKKETYNIFQGLGSKHFKTVVGFTRCADQYYCLLADSCSELVNCLLQLHYWLRGKPESQGTPTLSFLSNRFCCLFLIEGFVSNECGLFLFLEDAIAAAAATPTGPVY
jgi:hypothetical protein